MPTKAEHLEQASHNENLAGRLARMGEFGWAITSLFYSALHLIEAHLGEIGRATRNHARRNAELRDMPELHPIYLHYRSLKTESENSRYDCRVFSQQEFLSARDQLYRPIVQHMKGLVTA